MKATKARTSKLDAIKAGLTAAWKNRDPQHAAVIISAAGPDQAWAMSAAAKLGFIPEYYVNSIRVHLPTAARAARDVIVETHPNDVIRRLGLEIDVSVDGEELERMLTDALECYCTVIGMSKDGYMVHTKF
jgi:uncharacterized OsmC-like protein